MDPGVTLDGAWLEENGHAPGIERRDMHNATRTRASAAAGTAAPGVRPDDRALGARGEATSAAAMGDVQHEPTVERPGSELVDAPARASANRSSPSPHFACRARGRDGRAGYRGVDSGRFQNDTIVVASMPGGV